MKKLYMSLLLGSLPGTMYCSAFHRCMCGHLAHQEKYRILNIIIDIVSWGLLAASVIVMLLLHNIPAAKRVLMSLLMILCLGSVTGIPVFGIVGIFCIGYWAYTTVQANQAVKPSP